MRGRNASSPARHIALSPNPLVPLVPLWLNPSVHLRAAVVNSPATMRPNVRPQWEGPRLVRIVLTADNHLNAYYAKMTPRQLQGRRKRIRDAWRSAADYAIAHDCHMLLQAGDFFDMPDPRPTELVAAAQDFRRLFEANVRCFAIGGTHDVHRMATDGVLALRIYREVGLLTVFDKSVDPQPVVVDIEGVRIAVGGLSVDHRLTRGMDPLKDVVYEADADYRILLMHYGVEGSIHPDANEPVIPKSSIAALGVDLVCVGHVHLHGVMAIGATKVIVPGSTERHTFGELKTEPGFYYLELDRNGLQAARHVDTTPQMMDELRIKVTEVDDDDPTADVIARIRDASHMDRLLKCTLEGPMLREKFHKLRLREVYIAGVEGNFYFDLDTRAMSVSDGIALPGTEAGSVSISQRDEIAEVASFMMENANSDEERDLLKEATDRILSRYQATV
jgi:DNA repair exonuclease SbcCD nuclease subunit